MEKINVGKQREEAKTKKNHNKQTENIKLHFENLHVKGTVTDICRVKVPKQETPLRCKQQFWKKQMKISSASNMQ